MPAQFCIFVRAKNIRILKSLDCCSGKGKAKQMDILKKILSNAEIVNIKYPEKVFTISFISQYFAFNVCSLAFPQAGRYIYLIEYRSTRLRANSPTVQTRLQLVNSPT